MLRYSQNAETRDTTLGLHIADLPLEELSSGTTITFTFYWPRRDAGKTWTIACRRVKGQAKLIGPGLAGFCECASLWGAKNWTQLGGYVRDQTSSHPMTLVSDSTALLSCISSPMCGSPVCKPFGV